MSWVVDTCVIIDILRGDAEFSAPSADALDAKMEHGLLIAPITYVELAPSFGGNVAEQDELLADFGIGVEFGDNRDEILLAHRAWYEHVSRKRMGIEKRRPVADVLIGAYAMQKGGIITRNEDDFRSLYPKLNIFNPVKTNGALNP